MSEKIFLDGQLRGHNGWVTQIATVPNSPDLLISSSRDRSLLLWRLNKNEDEYGRPFLKLTGHNHFVSDMVLSSDGSYAISGSWDKTLRLWDLYSGKTIRRFIDHTKDVMSVAFSSDNRLIVSGSRDKTIKLWNTLGHCKFTIKDDCHDDWVSCIRFSPIPEPSVLVSCGWDMKIKVWNLKKCKEEVEHVGHTGYLNTVSLSPDGTLVASGGKDSTAMIWDMQSNSFSFSFKTQGVINAICFSPVRYWLALAVDSHIKIWDLESKQSIAELILEQVGYSKIVPDCVSLCWSIDGQTLFAGYTDNVIRIWRVQETYSGYF